MNRSLRLLLPLLAALVAAACQREAGLDALIRAGDKTQYSTWWLTTGARLPPPLAQELKECLAELRRGNAGGADEAFFRHIDRQSCRAILILGHRAKLERLQPDRKGLLDALAGNAWLITAAGDQVSARWLSNFLARQKARLARIVEEIRTSAARLRALDPAAQLGDLADETATTGIRPLSQAEALAEFASLLEQLRASVLLKYGGWPLKIDRQGAQLSARDRAELAALRAANPGRTIVPVQIKDTWLFFKAETAPLEFPSFFSANLTPEDTLALQAQWTDFSAERWARAIAFEW